MAAELFKSRHKVRTYECDFYGHVNNAIYLQYFEFGRMEALDEKGFTLMNLRERGLVVVVHKISVVYRYPAFAGDWIVIETRMKDIQRSRGIFSQEIRRERDRKLLTEAEVVWVFTNLNGRPVRVPQMMIDAFPL